MPAPSEPPQDQDGAPIGRRAFLGVVGVGLSSLLWGGSALRLASKSTELLPESIRASIPFGDGWRIYAVNEPYPRFHPATWRLEIAGLVAEPQTLSIADLRALPQARQTNDFHCVTGWRVDGVRWGGVRFADLLAKARPHRHAAGLRFVSSETPYDDTLTMDQALQPDAMLALDMDHKPLSRPHGAPARVVMPQMYGYKGVKWVKRIEVTGQIADGYWEQRGYDRDAYIDKSNGR